MSVCVCMLHDNNTLRRVKNIGAVVCNVEWCCSTDLSLAQQQLSVVLQDGSASVSK